MVMAKGKNSMTGFLEDIVDDTKDFVDDLLDRAKDLESDVRDSVKDAIDDDEHGGSPAEVAALRASLTALQAKVDELTALQAKASKN
jgi:polyhydroxyalkanoate synthesis regulator phasin